MPDVDVTDLLTDPDFVEQVTVRRITQTVSSGGIAQQSESDFTITAVVTIGSMLASTRSQDYALAKNMITVHSKSRLLGPTATMQADIVVWKGNNYVVKRPYDWSHYGPGFTAAECELQDTTGET
jgi:hypothetical protein